MKAGKIESEKKKVIFEMCFSLVKWKKNYDI